MFSNKHPKLRDPALSCGLSLLATAGLLTWSCATTGEGAPAAPEASASAPTNAPAAAAAPTSHRAAAPLDVTLTGREGTGGATELTAHLQVRGRLPAPPVVRLSLPAGAVLAEGVAEETLPLLEVGTQLHRRYLIRELRDGQARITVDAVSHAAGAHAEAIFPEPREKPGAPGGPRTVPLPRVTLPGGVTIDQAIPLQGKP